MPAASAAARPATEPPKKLDGNAVISHQRGRADRARDDHRPGPQGRARPGSWRAQEVTKGCRHDKVLPRRFGLDTLRFNKKIRVLYVTRTAMPTAKGIRVNDTLNRLKSKYGSKLQERPSDVSPETTIYELHGKGTREMQFSVNAAGKITQIATGLRPEVDFSEGCA